MKKYFYLFLVSFFLVSNSVFAANHYVRSDATGSNTGTDWINAYSKLPQDLIRGDTYYIADGKYVGYKIDDPVSGSLVITIKKATLSDHGTDTGWDNSYGDGQAIFAGAGGPGGIIKIITSYVVFDGVVGSGSNPDSYGFKINVPYICEQTSVLIGVPNPGYSDTLDISNVTISHVAMRNCGSEYPYAQNGIYSHPKSAKNITITYNYMADSINNMLMRRWSNCTISNNYFDGNWSDPYFHGQQITPGDKCNDITLSNNIFKDSKVFIVGAHPRNNERWKIYNNLIINGKLSGGFASAEGEKEGEQYKDILVNAEIHNNTFIDVHCGGYGAIYTGPLTDSAKNKSYAYNNLFYNCEYPKFTGGVNHTNSAHYNSSGDYDKNENGTAQILSSNPFVDAGSNYHLGDCSGDGCAIDNGKDLSAIFLKDIDNITRPQGSGWDIGAYEYSALYQTCSNLEGTCCPSSNICQGGSFQLSSDCGSLCCVDGTCKELPQPNNLRITNIEKQK